MELTKFTLSFETVDGDRIFTVVGRIDSTNAADFNNAVTSALNGNYELPVIFSLENLEYISSAGLRVLLSINKKSKSTIKLINVTPAVNNIFEVTGFSQIFDVSETFSGFSSETLGKIRRQNISVKDSALIA